jgi:hypothetical protein
MRIELGQLSASALNLELPPSARVPERALRPALAEHPARSLRIAAAEGLRGVLEWAAGSLQIPDLACTRLTLEQLAWNFGSVVLTTERPATLDGLQADIALREGTLALELTSAALTAQPLVLTLPGLRLCAYVQARDLLLKVGDGIGSLQCAHATFRSLELRTASLRLLVSELSVSELLLDWAGDFRLQAGTAEAAELSLESGGAKLAAQTVALAALVSMGRTLSLGQARVGRVDVRAALGASADERTAATPSSSVAQRGPSSEAPDGSTSSSRLLASFDPRLLSALAGRLATDVEVDLTLPILGRRVATHELRLAVDEGAINFRALEHCLAALEDSLLDFSVRDGALVLERGLPFLSTRGRGKPLLRWELAPDDLALAQEDRVRLAVLPRFRPADERPSQRDSDDGSGSALKLRSLSLLAIDAVLTLMQSPAVSVGAVRELTFANLTVAGEVHHQPGGRGGAGAVRLLVSSFRALLEELPIGARMLRGRVEVAALRDAEIGFEDLRPRTLRAALEGLALADLALS